MGSADAASFFLAAIRDGIGGGAGPGAAWRGRPRFGLDRPEFLGGDVGWATSRARRIVRGEAARSRPMRPPLRSRSGETRGQELLERVMPRAPEAGRTSGHR